MRERDLSDSIIKRLPKAFGGYWQKQPASRWGASGRSDIVGCWRGRYVGIELKQPGRYKKPEDGLSALQARHGASITANGGIFIVADSWELIETTLSSLQP